MFEAGKRVDLSQLGLIKFNSRSFMEYSIGDKEILMMLLCTKYLSPIISHLASIPTCYGGQYSNYLFLLGKVH